MGKLMHNTQIQHSSHPHLLHLSLNLHSQPSLTTCAGCDLHISHHHHVYTCTPCNFHLHPSCAKFPELITHPSHPPHALTLVATPTYPGGFQCDGCGHKGSRFSYHCTFCDFDLHVLCASKPLLVNHPVHPHPLQLTFSSPYVDKSGFSCDVCSNVGSCEQWLYRCVSCEFDVHLHCASALPPPPQPPQLLQHHQSFPVTHTSQIMGSVAVRPLVHSMSAGGVQSYQPPPQHPANGGVQSYRPPPQYAATGGIQSYGPPQQYAATGGVQSFGQPPQHPAHGGFQTYRPPPQQPALGGVQSYQPRPTGTGGVQSYQPSPQPTGPGGVQSYQPQPQAPTPGNGLANAMMTGFVEGAMQQIGQNFIQNLTGGDDNGGGGGDGDVDGDSSSL